MYPDNVRGLWTGFQGQRMVARTHRDLKATINLEQIEHDTGDV